MKSPPGIFILTPSPLIAGLAASAFTLLLGNLGTIQLIYQRLQQIGRGRRVQLVSIHFPLRALAWASQGLSMVLKGTSLAIGHGDWYWNPSRVVPPLGGNEITEFPLFTFIYSDLHAHMIAMPLALLALSWALAVVAGTLTLAEPCNRCTGSGRWRPDHRRVLSRQSIRYLYLSADRPRCAWICSLALRGCAVVLSSGWAWSSGPLRH